MRDSAKRGVLTLLLATLLVASPVSAQERLAPTAVPGPDYGVAVTPAVYLVNFLFMYFSNPLDAANMPAYRAPIPPQLADCLLAHPEGCPYVDYQQYLTGEDACSDGRGGDKCRWTLRCQVEPSSEILAPPDVRSARDVNKPLGKAAARRLARNLDIDDDFVLTPGEYQCLVGTPGQRSHAQDTIYACVHDLANSKGAADIPLSSFGLALVDPLRPYESRVRSVCAPEAPCLRMNALLEGPIEQIAAQCGFLDKFRRLIRETPIVRYSNLGFACQSSSITNTAGACMAETVRRR